MNNPSLVSIVIPTYNRATDLSRGLASIVKQTYSNWEVLVVDNNSTDNTHEVIKQFNDKRIKCFQIENNGVIAASRNLGIHHSNGEFIAFLDSDDSWKKEKLERSVSCLNAGFDFVYHNMAIISKKHFSFKPRLFRSRQVLSNVFNDLLINGNAFPTSSIVVRKDVLIKAGGFSEAIELIAGEDYDLWIRISELTNRFKKIEGTLGYLTESNDGNFSSVRLISFLSEIEKKYFSRLSTKECSDAYTKWIEYAYGRSYYKEGKYILAKNHLMKCLRTSNNLSFRIKAAYMLITIHTLKRKFFL